MNEICEPRNIAITSLLKLQNYGITDDEILNVYEYLNTARFEFAKSEDKDIELLNFYWYYSYLL